MKKRIAITGAKGTIGQVLTNALNLEYDITPLNLPEVDVANYDQLFNTVGDPETLIHLSWNTKEDNFKTENIDPKDVQMFFNVYKVALTRKIKRVIMASSVHADRFDNWQGLGKMNPKGTPLPDSPYGAMKVGMEAMGRYYSQKGLEVACIRFGGVNTEDIPPAEPLCERAVWLSQKDCVSLVKSAIEARTIPFNFTVVYGVSQNEGIIHDTTNPFGWRPQDSASKHQ